MTIKSNNLPPPHQSRVAQALLELVVLHPDATGWQAVIESLEEGGGFTIMITAGNRAVGWWAFETFEADISWSIRRDLRLWLR